MYKYKYKYRYKYKYKYKQAFLLLHATCILLEYTYTSKSGMFICDIKIKVRM